MATEARGTHCCPCLPRHMPVSFPPRSPQSSVVHYESPGPLTFQAHLPPQAMAACATGCGRVWLLSGQALAFFEKIIFVYECACINVHVCTYSCVRLCVRAMASMWRSEDSLGCWSTPSTLYLPPYVYSRLAGLRASGGFSCL